MHKNSFLITVKLCGVNLNRIYKECLNKNIKMYNINRVDYKNIIFDIEKSNLKNLKQIAQNQHYDIEIIKKYGILKLLSFLTKRVGIIVGAILFLLINILSSFFVWNIKIYGNNNVSSEQILSVLASNGIRSSTIFFKADFNQIEKQMLDKIEDLSLCSIIKKGSTIIVNIKEKLILNNFIDNTQQDIVATQNMTITSLSVVQGTALKKVGDSVKAGQTIVAGYFLDASGKKISCKANANIGATLLYSKTINYPKTKQIKTKTGNKIVNKKMTLFGVDFPVNTNQNTFENFEIEQTINPIFKNNFLPFYLSTTTYYETTSQLVEQNFEQDKHSVLENLKQQVLKTVPQNLTVSKSFETITENNNEYIITYYAQVKVDF